MAPVTYPSVRGATDIGSGVAHPGRFGEPRWGGGTRGALMRERRMREFRTRVAVVTGAASGIGRAMAGRFAAEGMRVVLADIEQGPLDQAAGQLRDDGAAVIGIRTDVSRPEDVQALADAAVAEFGAVHVLCNNAGVGIGS